MTGAAHPARAVARPFHGCQISRSAAGLVAAISRPSGPIIFDAIEPFETKTLIGQAHGAIRIAFACRDGISHSGDEDIAHHDLADQSLRRAIRQHDVHAGERCMPVADTQLYLVAAGRIDRARRAVTTIERPHAAVVRGQAPGEQNTDAMVARSQIAFTLAIALAGLEEIAGTIHA